MTQEIKATSPVTQRSRRHRAHHAAYVDRLEKCVIEAFSDPLCLLLSTTWVDRHGETIAEAAKRQRLREPRIGGALS